MIARTGMHAGSTRTLQRTVAILGALTPLAAAGARGQPAPPAQPAEFEAIAASPTQIRLYWAADAGATDYVITRDGRTVAHLPSSARIWTDEGLAPGSTHTYCIAAQGVDGRSTPALYEERTFAEFPAATHGRMGTRHFDVVVVQASSGGVAAAISAAQLGLKVALVEPTTRLGGMPVNGLSATDIRRNYHAAGFLLRFTRRVRRIYAAEGIHTNGFSYEPRVAQQAMKSLLYGTPGITIYRLARLESVETSSFGRRKLRRACSPSGEPSEWFDSLERTVPPAPRRRVTGVVIQQLGSDGRPTGQRALLQAGVFVDATDCGDLAAMAGARFRIGREAASMLDPHDGVIYYDRAADRLEAGTTGAADARIMSYAYLLTVKDYGSGTDHTIPEPPGYHEADYIHTPPWKQSWAVTSGRMPNGKFELNQHPQGNDLQAINYGYAAGSYQERARIEAIYRQHMLGYLYYLQTALGLKQLGLPDDEYRDSGGFPPLLYVREGRRIAGEETVHEWDVTDSNEFDRSDSIGIGDYPMDSHAVEPKTDWSRPDMGEGEYWLYRYTPVHELPMGMLIPRDLENVVVTTAVSATHPAFGTYRLEMVRMECGDAAGAMAWLALRYGLPICRVPARQVQDILLQPAAETGRATDARLVYYRDVSPQDPWFDAIQRLSVRGFRITGSAFRPHANLTRHELGRLLWVLAAHGFGRSAPDAWNGGSWPMQSLSNAAAVRLLQGPGGAGIVTRALFMRELASTLALSSAGVDTSLYADVHDQATARAGAELERLGIDSELWDAWSALTPNGHLLLQPNEPVTRDEAFGAIYVAQKSLGPLFLDRPADSWAAWPSGEPMRKRESPAKPYRAPEGAGRVQ
ncbi:MAG: FAD-dependent oxidoreductase [Armatimonadetes bacterium]|nr:FAD-dependent oxidoreductase [Armatimonadota bacterium]MDE2206553.1 FAD-dependent oxidoreductase [Armatimonadota bacterium]